MSFFADKVVIVTGSSNGIGRTTAVMLAEKGAKITITGRNSDTLTETKELCQKAGANPADLLELLGDVTDESFAAKLISATVGKFGKIDVLVNNAGGAIFANHNVGILDIPISEFDTLIDLNVRSMLRLSQIAVPYLEKTRGSIVNVSSVYAYRRSTSMAHLSVSKSTLDQVTVQMAGSLIKRGIRVNSVNPGQVITNAGVTAGAPKELLDKIHEQMISNPSNPLGRACWPDDIGKLILFLADRSQSEILVGHFITADGGSMLMSDL